MKDQPIYKHDCADCHYLGAYRGQDLYFFVDQFTGSGFIVRYGDGIDDIDMRLLYEDIYYIREFYVARLRAVDQGYIGHSFTFGHNDGIIVMIQDNIIPEHNRKDHIEPALTTKFNSKATENFPENYRMLFSDGDLVDSIGFTLKIISN